MSTAQTTPGPGHQPTIVADREGVITGWDSKCAQIFGYSSEEALGQTVALIIPPVLQARHWRGFNKAVTTGQLKRAGAKLKVPAVHKTGAIVAVEGTLTLTRTDDGTVDAVTLVLSGQGPGWTAAIWRAVLAVLRAGQALSKRIRPGARSGAR